MREVNKRLAPANGIALVTFRKDRRAFMLSVFLQDNEGFNSLLRPIVQDEITNDIGEVIVQSCNVHAGDTGNKKENDDIEGLSV